MFRIPGTFCLSVIIAGTAQAQWSNDIPPLTGGAVIVGAQGFARPPITSAVVAGYAHVPISRSLLLGAQAGLTFWEPERSHANYALASIAHAQRRAIGWQVYPFVAAGGAAFRTRPGDVNWEPAVGAGFGFDAIRAGDGVQPLIGARIGYITRSFSDDESIAYAAVGIGLGGRRGSSDAGERPVAQRAARR